MLKGRTIAVAAALAVAAPSAALAAGTSHAKLWQNSGKTVTCGVKIHAPGQKATDVICGAKGLPAPKHGVGDPFVQISAQGKPQVIRLSQDSFVGKKAATLSSGMKWSSLGVTCTVTTAKLVTCKNK